MGRGWGFQVTNNDGFVGIHVQAPSRTFHPSRPSLRVAGRASQDSLSSQSALILNPQTNMYEQNVPHTIGDMNAVEVNRMGEKEEVQPHN